MLKILHTADWHLGVRLHKKDLSEDHQYFFDFLIGTILERSIDVLLVSGDVFDHANPSQEALQQYYDVLMKLHKTGCKVILTGGNHDSPAILNMTRKFLKVMDIHVIGRAEKNPADQIIPLVGKTKKTEAVVCAVPYLRESDIRLSEAGETQNEKQQKRKEGMMRHFSDLVDSAVSHGKVPILMMAHLFASGANSNEQKRDITIGGLDAFSATDFPAACDYVALGHIHRPMEINGQKHIRYSGSPVALSFSEKEQVKEMVEISIDEAKIIDITTMEIPAKRKLIKFSGTFAEVKVLIEKFENTLPLKAFVELDIVEADTDLDLPLKVHQLVTEYNKEQLDILTYKYSRSGSELRSKAEDRIDIESWSENEVMEERMNEELIVEEDRVLIRSAFEELLSKIENENQ
jgi:exonuclease SbcD